MKSFDIIPAKTEKELADIATLASEIWHQYFVPLIGSAQVDYMINKFQSLPALMRQTTDGYEYFQLVLNGTLCGYTGIHVKDDALFLSKLYLKESMRGQHLSSKTFLFLKQLCQERHLSKIWLTCNKHNAHTLSVYEHFGFSTVQDVKTDIGNGFYMDDYILEYEV